MPNVAQVLKEEISRIARKEVKNLIEPLENEIARLRKLISEQKKKTAVVDKIIAKEEKKRAAVLKPVPAAELNKHRLSGNLIGKLRKKLKLSRREMADLLDVNQNSVFLWEQGKIEPRDAAKARIIGLRKLSPRKAQKLLAAKKNQGLNTVQAESAN